MSALRTQREQLQTTVQQKNELRKFNEGQLQTWQQNCGVIKEKVAGLVNNLQQRLNKQGIATLEELKGLFLAESEAQEIIALKGELDRQLADLKAQMVVLEKELRAETAKDLTREPEEVLLHQLQEQEEKFRNTHQEIGRIEEILKKDESLKKTHLEIAEAMELQKKEYDRWNRLSNLIGSSDGKKFSRFAQGLTLARLTELANRHLARLTDRYLILKTPNQDLELQIIDRYQADAVRPMTTLSGGESFLVSLALALGLSDLASRKVEINSLFIDEGFGTLDADTLDTAISALENLQSRGKTIGIISHVEALKERIGTQIQIAKQPGGASKIMLNNYGLEIMV